MLLLCARTSKMHHGAEVADCVDLSKVYHKVMSLSQTKGEWNSPFEFIYFWSYV